MFWFHHKEEEDATNANGPTDKKDDITLTDKGKDDEKEEVLEDTAAVLHELEEERRKTRELQAKIEALKKEQQLKKLTKKQQKRRNSSSCSSLSANNNNNNAIKLPRRELVALQAQVEGYKQLVDTLTAGRPAMDAAADSLARNSYGFQSTKPTTTHSRTLMEPNVLPLHVVRFLEIMPWHPVAQQASTVMEELCEWQFYCYQKETWRAELKFFPAFFKALPVTKPSAHGTPVDRTNKSGVWTNDTLTQRFDLRKGYFSPNADAVKGPVWKWIGPWHLDTTLQHDLHDEHGWAYAREAGQILDTAYLLDPNSAVVRNTTGHSNATDTTNVTLVRRRKWIRKRMLVDYPMASQSTLHYLALQANNQSLHVQLTKTQNALEETETNCRKEQAAWLQKQQVLEQRLQTMEKESKRQQELIDRQKGPSPLLFPPHNNDIQHENDSLQLTLKRLDQMLLLHPAEDGLLHRGSSPHHGIDSAKDGQVKITTTMEPAPDVEACSDDNCSDSEHDDYFEEEATTVFKVMHPGEEEPHKNFLQKLFSHES